ncbi:MAG: response regulator [Proteobacteria bacterium]|nr:response regulator [Pseudomonadota bacterium]
MKRILIVDADVQLLDFLAQELGSAGYETFGVTTAREALEIAESGMDMAILCVELPDQNGFVLCSKFKKLPDTASLPIFITSAAETTTAFEQHLTLANHADGYFLKPLDVEMLIQEMGNILTELDALAAEQAEQAVELGESEAQQDEEMADVAESSGEVSPDSEERLNVPASSGEVSSGSEEMIDVSSSSDDELLDDDSEVLKALSLDNFNLFADIDADELDDSLEDGLPHGFDDEPVDLIPESVPEPEPLPKPSEPASVPPPLAKPALPGAPPALQGASLPKPGGLSAGLPRPGLPGAKPIPSAVAAAVSGASNETVERLEAEIASLKAQLAASESRVAELTDQCDSLKTCCRQAEADLAAQSDALTSKCAHQKQMLEEIAQNLMALAQET